jgi:hypothetical protein
LDVYAVLFDSDLDVVADRLETLAAKTSPPTFGGERNT